MNFPYYRPITRSTFALQKTIWGNAPRPYHLFNAVLAGAVTIAVFGLLRRPGMGIKFGAALIASLWFSLHPAVSECIYPAASGRETLLPMLVILLACWAYFGAGKQFYWLAMLLFAVALLCKEQAAVLPGIFVLADALIAGAHPETPGNGSPGTSTGGHSCRLLFRATPGIQCAVAALSDCRASLDPVYSLLYGIQTAVIPFAELHYEPTQMVWFTPALLAICRLGICRASHQRLRRAGRTMCAHRIVLARLVVLLQLPPRISSSRKRPIPSDTLLAILAIPAMAAAVLSQPNALGYAPLGQSGRGLDRRLRLDQLPPRLLLLQ